MWKDIWVLMLVLAFIFFVISIVLMFVWNIPGIIDELSGRKAKRQIKMLHELNSSTSTFDKLSTNEIYSGMSSGTLLNEDLSNIDKDVVSLVDIKEETDENEKPTDFLDENEEETATSYLNDDEEDSTSYLDTERGMSYKNYNIKIIEEQSSL